MREVREETGIEIELDGELGWTRYQFRGARSTLNRKRVDWFLAHPVGGALQAEGNFAAAAYVTEAEAEDLLTHEADRDIARRAFEVAAERPG